MSTEVRIHVVKGREAQKAVRGLVAAGGSLERWPLTSRCCNARTEPRIIVTQFDRMGLSTEIVAPCCGLCGLLISDTPLEEMVSQMRNLLLEAPRLNVGNGSLAPGMFELYCADLDYWARQLRILYEGAEA